MGTSSAFVVGMVALGCGRGGQPVSAPTSTTAPPPAVAPAVPGPRLSAFVQTSAGCDWQRIDPSTPGTAAKPEVIATLPGSCFGATVAYAPDKHAALVRFDPQNGHGARFFSRGAPAAAWPDEPPADGLVRAFEVGLPGGAIRAVTVPSAAALAGEPLSSMGYGPDGIVVFSLRDLTDAELAAGQVTVRVRDADQAIPIPPATEGIAALASAWREDGAGGWVRSEAAATTEGWDYALGVRALHGWRALGPSTAGDLLDAHLATESPPAAYRPALDAIRAPAPPGEGDDGWYQPEGVPSLFVYVVTAEFAYTTGQLRFPDGPTAVVTPPGLGYTGGELAAVRVATGANGHPYALVAGAGAGTHPRVYDLADRTLVYASDAARGVHLWP